MSKEDITGQKFDMKISVKANGGEKRVLTDKTDCEYSAEQTMTSAHKKSKYDGQFDAKIPAAYLKDDGNVCVIAELFEQGGDGKAGPSKSSATAPGFLSKLTDFALVNIYILLSSNPKH